MTGVAWVKSRVATAAYGGVFLHDRSPAVAPDVMAFTGSLLSLSISPNRRWAASGNQDATLHVWGVGRRGEELSMAGYPSKISALEFSPDSSLLASGVRRTSPSGTSPQPARAGARPGYWKATSRS